MTERITFRDLSGGINRGMPPSGLKANELRDLRNFYPFGTKLKRRGGFRRILDDPPGLSSRPELYGFLTLNKSDGTSKIILYSDTFLEQAPIGGGLPTALSPGIGVSIRNSDRPWSVFQYKDIAYGNRIDTGGMIRCDGLRYEYAGIDAPTTAPTLANVGGGTLVAADYIGVVTFYNTNTGAESNPSLESNTITTGANEQINWSGIPVSSQDQVNARRLYRTLPDQSGEFYFVGQIDDNTTTTFTGDNVAIEDMGSAVSFNNGTPPDDLQYGVMWKERQFCTDERDLFYSEIGLPEMFGDDSTISVFPDDGHKLRGLHALGDRLIVGKTNKVHYLVGTDPANYALLTLTDRHGVASHHSLASAEGQLFWFGGDNFYKSDGNAVADIGSVKIRDYIDAIPEARWPYVASGIDPTNSLYISFVAQTGILSETRNCLGLVYNYKTDAWAVYDRRSD